MFFAKQSGISMYWPVVFQMTLTVFPEMSSLAWSRGHRQELASKSHFRQVTGACENSSEHGGRASAGANQDASISCTDKSLSGSHTVLPALHDSEDGTTLCRFSEGTKLCHCCPHALRIKYNSSPGLLLPQLAWALLASQQLAEC